MFITLSDKKFSIGIYEYTELFTLTFSECPGFEMNIMMSEIPRSLLSEQYE